MTPMPLNPPPASAKPAALPLVALILGVLGFCLPLLFPVAIVLAIVSLVKASEPAYAARKTLAIITLAMGVIYVPIVGILAAIAIPNFIKFQARSKQSECKSNLKAAYIAQRTYFTDKDGYGATAEEIGFEPMSPTRYLYLVSAEGKVAPTVPGTSAAELEAGIPGAIRETLGVSGTCPECEVTMACAGNLDGDATIDVWTVSTGERTVRGEAVPAGMPFNDVSDLTD